MIHWQNGPNDRAQAFRIGGAFNSQMYMGGVLVAAEIADITFTLKKREIGFDLKSRDVTWDLKKRDVGFDLKK